MILEPYPSLNQIEIFALIENLRPKFQLVVVETLIVVYFCFKTIWSTS